MLSCLNLIFHIPCLTMIIIFVSQSELVQNIESLVKHNFHILSKIHALKCKFLYCNIWKHPQSGYKGNHEGKENEKSILIMVYDVFTSKRKKNDIKLSGSQVVLYVDQWGCVKYKFGNLSWNWLDVFFDLTKGMTRSLLSNRFRNIKLDNKSYSLENKYLCFYVISLIHWWLCIGLLKLRLW